MPLIQVLIILALAGLALWVVQRPKTPIAPQIKTIITVVVIVAVVIWLLSLFGILDGLWAIQVGHGTSHHSH